MNRLTIELDDNVFSRLTAFARRKGKSAEEFVATVTNQELKDNEEMEQFEAMQREVAAKLTAERIKVAFAQICTINAPPLPGDEMPVLP